MRHWIPHPTRDHAPWIAAAATAAVLLMDGVAIFALPVWVRIPLLMANAGLLFVAWRRAAEERRQNAAVLADRAELQGRLHNDALTGLMNREAFSQALDELGPGPDDSQEILVLFFDLDRFKDVNDTLGHKAGDQLLVEVAERSAQVLGGCTAFARLGGDEFAAIIPCPRDKSPHDYGDAVVNIINEPFHLEGQTVEVAASVGLAIGDPVLDDGHELLRRADIAMYEAKRSSHGGCRIYDETLSSRQVHESFVRAGISSALAEGSFELHYQPLIDARTGEFGSVEALLRSTSADLRNVATSDIVAIAEGSGQIIRLTDWSLDVAIAALVELETLPVAVNVSPVYFRHPEFIKRISGKLLEAGADPKLLTVEVTEGVLISDVAAAKNSISRLRDIGIKVYLDDFGTCYSSLNYLQHFELDGLKLDRSFLANIGDRKKATNIIRSIIDFGHSLDMKVVVEGVESEWQARLVQLLGCDSLQGYELAVPMPLDALKTWREEHDGRSLPQISGADRAADETASIPTKAQRP